MYKLASVALTAALGVAGVTQSIPAEAHPYVGVGIGFPGVAVAAPFAYAPAYYGPYDHARGRYWRHEYERDRYDHDRFHHEHWNRR